jgi:glycosyltransferase involved in cell wall biosynthesis
MENFSSFKITIGLPVYNVEPYIKKCIDSILMQDIDELEIIVVDDCGNDNSINIVKEIKRSQSTNVSINIISHEFNKGVGEARNTIIKNAKGKYLYFLDPDDFLKEGALSLLYNHAEANHAEVTYGSISAWKDGVLTPFRIYPDSLLLEKDSFASYVYNSMHETIFTSSINILYLTSFIKENGLMFPDLKLGEDFIFRESFIPKVKRAVLRHEVTYFYYMRPNSLMQYQYRNTIDIKEAKFKLWFCTKLKETCKNLENEDYYPGKCTLVIKSILFDICGIIKHQKQFTEAIPLNDIQRALKHPAGFKQILHFNRFRTFNIFFYFISNLPTKVALLIIKAVGEKKGWIK